MSREQLIKTFMGVVAITMVAAAFVRPNINQKFHQSYTENLLEMQALSKQLTLDLLRSHLGYVLHYDFIEADLQRMQKAAQLSLRSPAFVNENFELERDALVNGYLSQLELIRKNVDEIKSYISLVRNSEKRSSAISRKIGDSDPDNVIMTGLFEYQQMLDAKASETEVLTHLNALQSHNSIFSESFQSLIPHAGILSKYRPTLLRLMDRTNDALSHVVIPEHLANAYQKQHVAATRKSTLLLLILGVCATLFVTSIFLLGISMKKREIEAKALEIEANIQASQTAVNTCTRVLSAISHGDFTQRITTQFGGELEALKVSVNQTADRVESTNGELARVMNAIEQGQFDVELDQSVGGSFRIAVESLLLTFKNTFSEIIFVMESMNQGEFNQRVNGHASGELNRLKNAVNGSMESLENSLLDISNVLVAQKNGNLLHRVTTRYPGQLLTLSDSVNVSLEKMLETFLEIDSVTDQVYIASTEIRRGNTDLTVQTNEAMGGLNSASATVQEMTDGLVKISEYAVKADLLAKSTNDKATHGRGVVADAVQAMEQINHSSEKISDIITVIDSIAFQTNLLALNASVEAARAGEQGRGFAVVASEVRNLAGRSATAAREIKELIEDSASKVERGSVLVNQSGSTLEEIVDSIQKVLDAVSTIANVSNDQKQIIDEVNSALSSLQDVTRKNVELARMTTASSDQSAERVSQLKQTMEFFQTDQNVHTDEPRGKSA